jgi:hypothetical protein
VSYRGVLGAYFAVWFMSIGAFWTNWSGCKISDRGFWVLIYSYAWVRAIIAIALLAQWGGQGHAAGKGHGLDSQKCQKKFHPNFYPLGFL